MAGESAARSARRMRERAERLQRAADQWERGAEGERRTADVLAALPAEQWTVLHDVRWPGRPRANIDHVVVGPTGVFVIDTKHWSGRITIRDGVLRQNGYRRDKAVAGAAEAAAAIAALVPDVRRSDVHAVLCFVPRAQPTTNVGGVVATSTDELLDQLRARPVALAPATRQRVASDLEHALNRRAVRRPPSAAASPGVRRTTRPKRPAGRGLVARLVGVALALGAVGVAASTDAFGEVGRVLVDLVSDDDRPAPVDGPGQPDKPGKPGKQRP